MTSTSTNHWLPIPEPKPDAHLRLFCFPYAGGAARIFNAWSDQIPETMELCPVELPGHGRRLAEKPYARLSPLVEAIAIAINPFLDKPFAFFVTVWEHCSLSSWRNTCASTTHPNRFTYLSLGAVLPNFQIPTRPVATFLTRN